ncbi:hypothetical protein GCM10009736_62080 [Actinomadura bangladeshensis]
MPFVDDPGNQPVEEIGADQRPRVSEDWEWMRCRYGHGLLLVLSGGRRSAAIPPAKLHNENARKPITDHASGLRELAHDLREPRSPP